MRAEEHGKNRREFVEFAASFAKIFYEMSTPRRAQSFREFNNVLTTEMAKRNCTP